MKSIKIKQLCATAVLTGSLVIAGFLLVELINKNTQEDRAINTLPSPTLSSDLQSWDEDGFPEVEWEAYQAINTEVVGWITIPGTTIDSPIVQAQPDSPQYYLHHDYTGEPNEWGAVYIDADCENGLDSPNVFLYGHNMSNHDSKMFGEIAMYSDYEFAAEHQEVLIQTPNWKKRISVAYSSITPGWEPSNRTSFVDKADFAQWLEQRYDSASMKLINDFESPEQVFILCTCSYTTYSDERTLVYAY